VQSIGKRKTWKPGKEGISMIGVVFINNSRGGGKKSNAPARQTREGERGVTIKKKKKKSLRTTTLD